MIYRLPDDSLSSLCRLSIIFLSSLCRLAVVFFITLLSPLYRLFTASISPPCRLVDAGCTLLMPARVPPSPDQQVIPSEFWLLWRKVKSATCQKFANFVVWPECLIFTFPIGPSASASASSPFPFLSLHSPILRLKALRPAKRQVVPSEFLFSVREKRQ